MGKDRGARDARRARRTSAPRGPMLATFGVLVLFLVAIGGLLIAASHHRGNVGEDPQADHPIPPPAISVSPPVAHRGPAEPAVTHFSVIPGLHLKRAKALNVLKPTTFRVASFNVLGASHTTGPNARKGYASGPARMVRELEMIRNHGVTVAGLQEFQPPQVAEFEHLTGSTWGVYPGPSIDNSIVWLKSEWTLVKTETRALPYFHGRKVNDPAVELTNVDSGQKIWFFNVHNPADVSGMHNAGYRAASVTQEAAFVRELNADGTPVVFTGDMNDRQLFACSFTRQSGMHSSDGWHTSGTSCLKGTGYPNVDWIMGSAELSFTDGAPDFTSEHLHLSDHPIITATATIAGG